MNEGADVEDSLENFGDEGVIFDFWFHGAEAFLKIIEENGLVEEFGAVFGVLFFDDHGEGFGTAEPTTEAHELGEFFAIDFDHGIADIVEGEIELFADAWPVFGFGGFGDGFGTDLGFFLNAEGFGEIEDTFADLFDFVGVFGFDGDEAFGDHRAEEEGDLGLVAGGLGDNG